MAMALPICEWHGQNGLRAWPRHATFYREVWDQARLLCRITECSVCRLLSKLTWETIIITILIERYTPWKFRPYGIVHYRLQQQQKQQQQQKIFFKGPVL